MPTGRELKDAFRRTVAVAERQFNNRQFEPAAQTYAAASRIDPGNFGAIYNHALSLQMLGRVDEAMAQYNRVRYGPSRVLVLLNLAVARPSALTQAEIGVLAEAARAPETEPGLRMKLWFALGYLRDLEDRFDEAFEAFAEGARLKAATFDMAREVAQEKEQIARVRRDFTPASIARWTGRGNPSPAPIFIVGKPRSGSTLVEQILATHPKAQGLGEIAAFDQAIGGQLHWPPVDGEVSDHFRDVGADYLAAVRKLGWKRPNRFVDKLLTNWLNVGAIALAFPHATILHCVRDPIDTCFSWYRHLFTTGNELSYDLAEAGRAYVRYRELMDYWTGLLPGRVIEVSYERLVADPERQIRWLATEACGLPWSNACLRFYDNDRFVDTESKFQVRRPIFDTSIGRWRRYAHHLGPLIEALGPYAPAEPR